MAQRGKKQPAKAKSSLVSRARKAVSRIAKKVTSRLRSARKPTAATAASAESRVTSKRPRPTPKASRAPRVSADIPIDVLNRMYTPTQTSLKAPFRITGDDRQRDQEFASGFADERFNEEDRLTNKSGDPRIGTHGRRYEPNE